MESIIRDVSALDESQRHAMENVLGRRLQSNQRLIISVSEIDLSPATIVPDTRRPQSIEDWTKLYEGLSDQQIQEIDKISKTRANLSRNLP